ncbi:MAG TPA: class I adenylate-forming enzyme family protein [Gammaproteobacteria bacterium]|nr:class I adenylate-forming enzyme family protein [Gammaproteobacteria bacterium]
MPQAVNEAAGAPEPAISIEQAVRRLAGPGAPLEIGEVEIRGNRTRVWKITPPSLRTVVELSREHGDLPFIVYEDERMTYAEHFRKVTRLAHVLRDDYGVRKGDRVALAMRNYPEWPVIFWAVTAVGAVIVPLNSWWTGAELEYGIADSGSTVLFVDGERAERLASFLDGLDLEATVVARPEGELPPGTVPFDDVMADAADRPESLPEVEIEPEDYATIFYTSGTTGKPKGALGTHRNICTNLVSSVYARCFAMLRRGEEPPLLSGEMPEKTGALLSVPFFHATGCHSVLVTSTFVGNKLVLMYKWDPGRAMELIEREKLNMFGGVPAMVWQVLEHPDFHKYDLSTIDSIGYGGAPAAPELVARIHEEFPEVSPSNGYGLTETSSITTMNPGIDYLRKPDSVGLPVPVCEVKVCDPEGNTLPVGEVGELWIFGPNVVVGYWNKPEATEKSFVNGWHRSGDLARLDEEGFVYIVDRVKDMVIRGGENVYCVEVEDALYDHPAVMDAAVFGIPDRVMGEQVAAVVQVTPGSNVTVKELQTHVAGKLAGFKVPAQIGIRHEPLPRNANGKILKRGLKSGFNA